MAFDLDGILNTYNQAVTQQNNDKHKELLKTWSEIEQTINQDMLKNAQDCKLYVDYDDESPMYDKLIDIRGDSQLMSDIPIDINLVYAPIENIGEQSRMILRVTVKKTSTATNE